MIVTITVYNKRVEVTDQAGYTMRQCDATALIDGEMTQYIYRKDSLCDNKLWRDQASATAFYDAKNRGETVVWKHTNKPARKGKKTNPNQKSLF